VTFAPRQQVYAQDDLAPGVDQLRLHLQQQLLHLYAAKCPTSGVPFDVKLQRLNGLLVWQGIMPRLF
jgi:hypothetical protein